jgi:uncharacterized delta-60 repeat protein
MSIHSILDGHRSPRTAWTAGPPRFRALLWCGVFLLGLAARPPAAAAADGTLDATFGRDAPGKTIVFFEQGAGDADVAKALAVDPASGAIFVAGTVAHDGATTSGYGIAKLTGNGHPDPGFGNLEGLFGGTDGRMTGVVSGREVEPLAVRIGGLGAPNLVGAAPPSGSGAVRMFALEANAAGTSASSVLRGLTIPGGSTAEPYVYDATVDAAGRTLVCGLTVVSGFNVGFVARLTSAHALDTSFGSVATPGWVTLSIIDPSAGATWCEGVEVDREGRVLTVLHGLNYSTLQAFGAVERRSANTALVDATFGAAGLVILNVRPDAQAELLTDLAVTDYGDIYVVGYAQGPDGSSSLTAIFRHISENGSSVTPFELYFEPIPPETYTRSELTRAVVDPTGRLVAGGTLVRGSAPLQHRMMLIRFASPFTLDTDFGSGGFAFVDFTDVPGFSRPRADLEDLIVAPDGRLLVAGRALFSTSGNNYDFAVARLESSALFLDGFETGDDGRWSSASP